MNHIPDLRWEQLRAIEADLLSPPPADPFQCFPTGWKRATAHIEHVREVSATPPPPREPFQIRRVLRRTPQRAMPIPDARPLRQLNGHAHRAIQVQRQQRNQNQDQNEDNGEENVPPAEERRRRRALSPTQMPGVHAIPKDFNRFFRGLLSPGEYFAKSRTRYLGPFEAMPNQDTLPADDNYIILQRMGRFPDSGKSIFRQVGNLST
ncbi:unnamed protein product [Caenorhabditis sp. 36 PRJEB53466]|nr:unnamed protein product [Caenorhabditis sp. 36 PRJEB53466]